MAGDFKLAEAFVEIKQRGVATTKRGLLGIKSTLGGVVSGFGMLGRAIKRAFSPMRMAMAGIASAFAIRGLLKLASDAEEVGSKFNTVFKNMSAEAEQTARNVARYMGASLTESKKAIGDLGDLFKPLGYAEADALKLSAQMVRLAADISSFSNMPMDEALTRLRGTLVGSHENALAFGVVINENTLKAEMAALGTDKLTGAMKEQAKVAARLSLLMKGTADAQGDLGRTSDSFANSMKRMKSLLREVGELVGKTLVPIFSGLGNILSSVAEKFREGLGAAMPALQAGLAKVKAFLDGIAEAIRNTDFTQWGKNLAAVWGEGGEALKTAMQDAGDLLMETIKAIGGFLLDIAVVVGQLIGEGIVKATQAAIGGDAGELVGEMWRAHKIVTGTAAAIAMGMAPEDARRHATAIADDDAGSPAGQLRRAVREAFGPQSPLAKLVASMTARGSALIPPKMPTEPAFPFSPDMQLPKPKLEPAWPFSPDLKLPKVVADKKPDGIASGMHSFSSLWSSVQNRLSKGEEALLKEAKEGNEKADEQVKLQQEIARNTKAGPAFA